MSQPLNCDDLKFSLHPSVQDTKIYKRYYRDGRWEAGQIVPFQNFSLSPAANILNYGQGIFEGLKAYYSSRGKVVLFRPEMNARRFYVSAERLAIPPIPPEQFVEAVKATVLANLDFIPQSTDGRCSMYLRPVCIATEPQLGVNAAQEYLFYIFGSPVGPYFHKDPVVRLLVTDVHRAAPRGTGDVKAVCNYAVTMRPKREAKAKGFNDALYLDPVHNRYIEEAGAANVFVLLKNDVLVTPNLGAILPGITRDSIITLARDQFGLQVQEREVSIEEVLFESKEVFLTGTAAIVASVSEIGWKDEVYSVNRNDYALGRQLYQKLTGIQLQKEPDPYHWVVELT